MASSPWSLLRPTKDPKMVLVLEPSCRRLGLIGGSGGAKLSDLLLDLERLLQRSRLAEASAGSDTVGTREVDMTKVGSEISRFLTLRFMLSLSPGTSLPSELRLGLGVLKARGDAGRPEKAEGMGEMGEGLPSSESCTGRTRRLCCVLAGELPA